MHSTFVKRLLFGLFAILLCGCSAQQTTSSPQSDVQPPTTEEPFDITQDKPAMPKVASLPDLGPAPELTNDIWLNVPSPLRIADLQGKVVIVEMWTFGCINCQHVIPSLKDWHSKYADQGLVIIGNHYPEFSYEEDLDNVKDAVDRLGIEYAVAQDNGGKTWRAYKNHYWPTLYLIDKNGVLRKIWRGVDPRQHSEEVIAAIKAL